LVADKKHDVIYLEEIKIQLDGKIDIILARRLLLFPHISRYYRGMNLTQQYYTDGNRFKDANKVF
jgi:hypothetical protein